jgi:hypothetical protein
VPQVRRVLANGEYAPQRDGNGAFAGREVGPRSARVDMLEFVGRRIAERRGYP